LNNYSSRRATFTATISDVHHRSHRTLSGFDGPSAAAKLGFSFPQPADVEELEDRVNASEPDDDEDAEVLTQAIEPVATNADDPPILGIDDERDVHKSRLFSTASDTGLRPSSEAQGMTHYKSPTQETYVTAKNAVSLSLMYQTLVTAKRDNEPHNPKFDKMATATLKREPPLPIEVTLCCILARSVMRLRTLHRQIP
jgi:hypothetical protein